MHDEPNARLQVSGAVSGGADVERGFFFLIFVFDICRTITVDREARNAV